MLTERLTCPTCGLEYVERNASEPCPRCLLRLALDEQPFGPPRSALFGAKERYIEMRDYATGGMGRISIAVDTVLGREIAIKELKPSGSGSSHSNAVRSRFIKEARIAGLLEHPSIIPVYDIGESDEGVPYYAMKLVRGKSLKEAILNADSLTERLALLPHVIDLAHAIAFAHDKGVIHRDIKPSNIVIGAFGETVVIDWGIAKIVNDDSEREDAVSEILDDLPTGHTVPTEFGMALGTPGYMAPEQALGKLEEIDARSDVFSLGAIVYEVLTGQPPYTGDTMGEVMRKNLAGDYPAVTSLEPKAPPELISICTHAMSRDPAARYQTALGFAEDLTRFKADSLVSAYTYSLADLARRYVRRHKVVTAVVALALIALVTTGGVSYANILRANERERASAAEATDQRAQAEYNQYLTSIQLAALRLRDRNFSEARDVLQRAAPAYRNWEWGYLYRQTTAEDTPVRSAPNALPPDAATADIWNGVSGAVDDAFQAHDAQINRIVFDDEGRIATCSADGTVRVWTAGDRAMLVNIDEGGDYIQSARFSPDSALLITVKAYENTAQLWQADTGAPRALLTGHSQPVAEARFSADGAYVVTASTDGTARLWSCGDGSPLRTIQGGGAALFDAAFSADGTTVYTASLGGEVAAWDVATGERSRTIAAPKRTGMMTIQFDSSLQRILSAYRDGTTSIWRLDTGEQVSSQLGLAGVMDFAAFSPDGSAVVAPAENGGVIVWNATTGKTLARVAQRKGRITAATFTPDGRRIVVGDLRGELSAWSPQPTGAFGQTGELEGHEDVVFTAGFSPDSQRLVTGAYDGTARVWDTTTGESLATLTGHDAEVVGVEFTNAGSRIVTIGWNTAIHTWDATTYEPLKTVPSQDRGGASGAFFGGPRTEFFMNLANIRPEPLAVNDAVFLAPDSEKTFGTWLLPEWRKRASFDGHEAQVAGSALSPDGAIAATGAMDGTALLWRVETGEIVQRLAGHKASVTTLTFSPGGETLLTTSLDKTAKLWDTATGVLKHELTAHTAFVTGGAFNPRQDLAVTFSADSTAILWDAETGEQRSNPMQHGAAVLGARFSPDGSRLLTVTLDGVRIWDMSGNELVTLTTGSKIVFANWSPDGKKLVISCRDGSVCIRNAENGA